MPSSHEVKMAATAQSRRASSPVSAVGAGPNQARIPMLNVERPRCADVDFPPGILKDEEIDVLQEFCDDIARVCGRNDVDAHPTNSLKFMLARKFDAARAFELFQKYKRLRYNLKMERLHPREEPLYSELSSGKITFLKDQSPEGCHIGVFTVSQHKSNEEKDYDLLLQNLFLNIDAILKSIDAQQKGLIFIVDLKGAPPSMIDRHLAIKILNTLQDNYPLKIHRIFVVESPRWMRVMYKCVWWMIKPKIRKRVSFLTQSTLHQRLARDILPTTLGGTQESYHTDWLKHCLDNYDSLIRARRLAYRGRALSASAAKPAASATVDVRPRANSVCPTPQHAAAQARLARDKREAERQKSASLNKLDECGESARVAKEQVASESETTSTKPLPDSTDAKSSQSRKTSLSEISRKSA